MEKKRNLSKNYNPHDFEDRTYKMWEEGGYFKAHVDERKKPFTIVMPPPNITGQLHMGHALDQTLQDVLTRWKRLQGYSALWVPGSDHASIATEVKVVEKIRQDEGLEKEDLGREEFLKRAWEWKEVYGGKITEQCRKLGDSCDWSRERFTMDDGCSKAVIKLFVDLYEKGYIYRGNRLINWCPTCGTSLSDAEVEHEEKAGKHWYFRYDEIDGNGSITVATSRPETMFADVAIAVNPNDERYTQMVGKKVRIPLTDKEIPIIADIYPDPEKGTGAVKITPAHDPNDFEVGQRNKLEKPVCIDFDAKMTNLAGKYEGMTRYECREQWIKDLEAAGHMIKIEENTISSGGCYRCDTVVEPMLSDQWFVSMQKLAEPAIKVAKEGKLLHVPERFEKIYLNWLEEIRDWCISRQLWWGHRIPAYYCDSCNEIHVSENPIHKCPLCGADTRQDEDVLDTWFSSALWPFSTLGWPEKTKDLNYFYPTDVLVTGYDIIFFWVVRMVFSALYVTNEVPFKYVYVHGLVRDSEGRKMSKSLGNGIDPLEVINDFGADALRFMLVTGTTSGNDMRFKEDKLESSRNFANKLWNASRFVIMNLQDEDGNFFEMGENDLYDEFGNITLMGKEKLADEDKWILARVNETSKYVTKAMEKFDLGLASQKIYELIWNEYCDWYIEIVKGRLYGSDEEEKEIARYILTKSLKDMLKLLHPYMPFITEEIWGYLPKYKGEELLINATWPQFSDEELFEVEVSNLEFAMETIKAIRNIRAEAEAPPSKALNAFILPEKRVEGAAIGAERYIKKLANINEIKYIYDKNDLQKELSSTVVDGAEIFIPLEELLDIDAEIKRLQKEKEKLLAEVKRVEGKLSNQGFISKAPEKVVEEEKEKMMRYKEMLTKVEERLLVLEKSNV